MWLAALRAAASAALARDRCGVGRRGLSRRPLGFAAGVLVVGGLHHCLDHFYPARGARLPLMVAGWGLPLVRVG